METINKKDLSETEIRTKYINPAIVKAGWNIMTQVREEYKVTEGTIIAREKVVKREKPLFADYVLFYKPNKPIAVIEAKDNNHAVGFGMQQALRYAEMLDVPFVFSSNGDGFVFHNRYINTGDIETQLSLDNFPSPEKLWEMYKAKNHIAPVEEKVMDQPIYLDNPNKQPRYYQQNAINKVTNAIAKGQNRILLVMATGTGKTYTAFQIIWKLWKAGIKKRILFLTDRRILISQTFKNDFAPFKDKMIWVSKSNFDTAHEIYLGLYQGLSSDASSESSLFKQFSPNFFDLVIVDECHRGSAKADSEWREILEYFKNATQIGMTATPKETKHVSNIDYFGDPVYTYSLKQGIEDGFLAPYRVIRVFFDKDTLGFIPYLGQRDDNGELIEDRQYNQLDFDKDLVLANRTKLVAKVVSDYLKKHNARMDKTIFFCVDTEHADRMRIALQNENSDLCAKDSRYVMRITSNDEVGVEQLDNFADNDSKYPVLVTTSKLLTTGVDVQNVRYIVLDSNIQSMTEFKQIIGRGTRIQEDYGKMYFTIFDFRDVTRLFHDSDFDGPLEKNEKYEPDKKGGDDPTPPPPVPPKPPKPKYYLGNEEVKIEHQQIQYLDKSGHLITESLEGFSKKALLSQYKSLDEFLNTWNEAERKEVIIKELEDKGVYFDELCEAVGKDLDPFDMILHLAFDKPPLTRRERVEGVKKSTYFAKYTNEAREILEIILNKYGESGILDIENADILKVDPINDYGTQLHIVNDIFGGIQNYMKAIKGLETAIYSV